MIKVNDVSLILNHREILKSINLTMENGHIYGLVGNNGSGKTMLMKTICGLIRPTSGEVLCDGKIIGRDADYLPEAGVIIETPGFISYYSGRKNLQLLAGIRRRIDAAAVDRAMLEVGLDPASRLAVKKYSLGMRQRLGIAQALMENPRYLILDEPMNGLDKNGIEEVRNLILKKKKAGCLIILSSHNKEDIEVLCDNVYEMEMGHVTIQRCKPYSPLGGDQ